MKLVATEAPIPAVVGGPGPYRGEKKKPGGERKGVWFGGRLQVKRQEETGPCLMLMSLSAWIARRCGPCEKDGQRVLGGI